MRKIFLLAVLMIIPFGFVEAKDLEINNLTIEGKDIELETNVFEYDVTVTNEYDKISISLEVDDGVTYEISGNENLEIGSNIVEIELTDGVDNTTYKLNVLKMIDDPIELSNNNYLKNLSISGYPLGFDSEQLEYNLTIGSEAKLRINYETQHDKAEVYVSGNEGLVNGSVISIKVVAQSGDVREYKINITATEVREEVEVYQKEKYDLKLIAYGVAAALISIFLIIINITGKKEKKN